MMGEDQVRDLLRDPRWSLPAWPDAQGRVRRAARRQRLNAASVVAAMAAVVMTAAVVPVVMLDGGSSGVAADPGRGAAGGSNASFAPSARQFAIPPVGAAGFAVSIYPAARKPRVLTGFLTLCPSPAGLQVPGRNAAAESLAVLRKLQQSSLKAEISSARVAPALMVGRNRGQSLTSVLRLSDRAFWPQLVSGTGPVVQTATVPVLYSGPLRSYHQATGPPDLARLVATGCGSRLARDTWVIVSGHPARPALAATFFLNRRGHVLLYNAT
jgi:hypothetical protein